MGFTSDFMEPDLNDKVQFILLQYKCIGNFNVVFDNFIFFGFRGEDEYAGFNRLWIYNLFRKSVIVDDFYITDKNLESILREVFQKGAYVYD